MVKVPNNLVITSYSNLTSEWKDDVDKMVNMTQTRTRYNPELFNMHQQYPQQGFLQQGFAPQFAPQYIQQSHPQQPAINQSFDVQEEIESERFRSHMLERQVNEMAREHAREKQTLVRKNQELK